MPHPIGMSRSWRAARSLLRFYYRDGRPYLVPFGPLRGHYLNYETGMTYCAILGLTDLLALRVLRRVFQTAFSGCRDLIAVDAGANRGLYSLWMARTGFFKTIHSFEPNPVLVASIQRNLILNHTKGVEVHAMACADRAGEMSLLMTESDYTSSLIPTSTQLQGRAIKTPTTSLDQFFENRMAPDFIKVDIEGAGVLALPASYTCIGRRRPLLYIESHSQDEDRAIGNLMVNLDYQAYCIQTKSWVELADEVFPNPRGVSGNLIVVPTERQDSLSFLATPVRWQRSLKRVA